MELTPIKIIGERYPAQKINSEEFLKKCDDGIVITEDRQWNMYQYLSNPGYDYYFDDKGELWIKPPWDRNISIESRSLVHCDYSANDKPLNFDTTNIAKEFSRIEDASDIDDFSLQYGLLGYNSEYLFDLVLDGSNYSICESMDRFIYPYDVTNQYIKSDSSKTYESYFGARIKPGYILQPDWIQRPWIETVTDWLHHSKKVRSMLEIYKDLADYKKVDIKDCISIFDHLEPGILPITSTDPRKTVMQALAFEISGELKNNIDVGYSEIEETDATPIGYRILETRTTKHLLAAIYYDLWRTITAFEPIYICNYCKRPIINKIGRRLYCEDRACKQAAYRKRTKEKH